MFLWILMLCVMGAGCLGCAFYLAAHIRRFSALRKLEKKRSWLISAALVAIPAVVLSLLWTSLNMAVCLLHLTLFWMLADLASALIRRLRKKTFKRYWAGAAAIALSVAWLGAGWFNANHVWQTNYTVETDKAVGNLRIALLAASHMGTTFHADGFAAHLMDIQAQNPDIVVIAGDFVDESTSREDMIAACRALGTLKTPYGVYYVFGNHDGNNYAGENPAYTAEELTAELEQNGVTVLEDETVLIDDRFALIGRRDASDALEQGGSRASMAELTQGLDGGKYAIVLDHQPRDYAAQAESGVDLVLSGHTHGGQLIPLVQLVRWFHLGDDNVYGVQRHGNTDFIVTSGISDWELLFKTGCRSEYVMIDIHGKE